MLQHNLILGFGFLGFSCATGLHYPLAFSHWVMQGQCNEVVEVEPRLSIQCLRGMNNEDRSCKVH